MPARPTLAEAQAQLDAVKAALTEQYRARRRQTPRPEPAPPAWLTAEYRRQAIAADTPTPKRPSIPNPPATPGTSNTDA